MRWGVAESPSARATAMQRMHLAFLLVAPFVFVALYHQREWAKEHFSRNSSHVRSKQAFPPGKIKLNLNSELSQMLRQRSFKSPNEDENARELRQVYAAAAAESEDLHSENEDMENVEAKTVEQIGEDFRQEQAQREKEEMQAEKQEQPEPEQQQQQDDEGEGAEAEDDADKERPAAAAAAAATVEEVKVEPRPAAVGGAATSSSSSNAADGGAAGGGTRASAVGAGPDVAASYPAPTLSTKRLLDGSENWLPVPDAEAERPSDLAWRQAIPASCAAPSNAADQPIDTPAPVVPAGCVCPAGRRPFHTILTAQASTYQRWQTLIFYHHFKKQQRLHPCTEMVGFTRLLASNGGAPDDLMDLMKTVTVDQLGFDKTRGFQVRPPPKPVLEPRTLTPEPEAEG